MTGNKRNNLCLQKVKNNQEGLLIGYFAAGDPNPDKSLELLTETVSAGLDILEIGVPSANPVYDGEIIQRAHYRARLNGAPEEWLPDYMKALRERVDVPLWAMAYHRDFIANHWYEIFVKEGWIDGLVIPDTTDEELARLQEKVEPSGVDVIRFINPGMKPEQLETIAKQAKIIYAQMYAGTTGDPFSTINNAHQLLSSMSPWFQGMAVAGFGLKNADNVREIIEKGYDGAVVGSALVSKCEFHEKDGLYRLISEMKQSTLPSSKAGEA